MNRPSDCKQCGLPVLWQRATGKRICVNLDGTEHWDRCSAARWGHVAKQGQRFERVRGADTIVGYLHQGKEKLERISAIHAEVGKNYAPLSCGDCDTPPWELCHGCVPQWAWMQDAGL